MTTIQWWVTQLTHNKHFFRQIYDTVISKYYFKKRLSFPLSDGVSSQTKHKTESVTDNVLKVTTSPPLPKW